MQTGKRFPFLEMLLVFTDEYSTSTGYAMTSADPVESYYSGQGLAERIFTALKQEGHSTDDLTPEILAPYDEFHVGGMAATYRVADRLHIQKETRLLDIGCGAGGPARAVAARYECSVTGIDLTKDFIDAGDILSQACGLQDWVSLKHGSALDMPFDDNAFDRAMMLHVGMNISDKPALMREAARVLAPGAVFCVYDMMRTGDGMLNFPLPWASDASVSAVTTPQIYIEAAQQAGFTLQEVRDETEAAAGFIEHILATKPEPAAGGTSDRFRNLVGHIESGVLAPTELMFRREGQE